MTRTNTKWEALKARNEQAATAAQREREARQQEGNQLQSSKKRLRGATNDDTFDFDPANIPLPNDTRDWEMENDSVPSLTDLLPNTQDTNMQEGNDSGSGGEPEAARASVAASGGNSAQSKETPISRYPTLTYGLQETHTTILPWKGWVSYAWLDKSAPLKLSLRLNSIWDIFPTSVENLTSGATIAAKAFYNRPIGTGAVNAATATFPMTMSTTVPGETKERPQWRDWWAQQYEYYTVLGCEWKIVISNVQATRGADVLIAYDQDSYSDTAGATGNVTPSAPLSEMLAFKGINYKKIEAPNQYEEQGAASTIVLSGTYRPGDIRRNVKNDGDVKTWTATSTTLPTLKDTQNFYIYQDALNYVAPGTISSGAGNIEISLKYIVQFKDLKNLLRYPTTVGADTDITLTASRSGIVSTGTDEIRYTQE